MSGAIVILFVMICCDIGYIRILTEYSKNYFIIDRLILRGIAKCLILR